MGYYHVNRTGKGKYLDQRERLESDKVLRNVPSEWLPSSKWLAEKLYAKIHKQYDTYDVINKIYYIGCLIEPPYDCSDPGEFETWELPEAGIASYFKDDSEYSKWITIMPALGVIFSYINDYPTWAFTAVSDYDGTRMIFLDVPFPLPEYSEKLIRMTEKDLGQELADFYNVLVGEKMFDADLEFCEEYIKE